MSDSEKEARSAKETLTVSSMPRNVDVAIRRARPGGQQLGGHLLQMKVHPNPLDQHGCQS